MLPLFICTIEDPVKRSTCELLYLKYRQHMFGVARSILKDDALSEDVVQDVFMKLIEKDRLPSLEDPKTKAFLTVAAERRALDVLRGRKNISEDELSEVNAGVCVPMEASELAMAINGLPAAYREVVLLHYYMGYSPKELAKQLGIEHKSVLKRLERARGMLKEIMQGE